MKRIITLGFRFNSLLILCVALISLSNSQAQLSVTSPDTPFTIDFDANVSGVNNGQFLGTGFQSSPSPGQLDSDAWTVTGTSSLDQGESAGGVTDGGIYAFNVSGGSNALGFQPSTGNMIPGEIILLITNNTGGDVGIINLSYEVWQYNDQNRSSSLNFSYSIDNIFYTSVPSLNFTSDEPGIPPNPPVPPGPAWEMVTRSYTINLNATPLSNGSSFYLKWTTDDVGGSNLRDELAVDDISITMKGPVAPDTDSEAQTIGGFQPTSSDISSLANTEIDANEVFWFQIQDLGISDGLPTLVEKIRLVPGPSNNESWMSQIQGITIDDFFGSFYTIQSVDITDSYIDITFPENELSIADNTTQILRLYVYLHNSGLVDGAILQFQIDSDAAGFSTFVSGSSFATSFPADIISSIHTIDVDATELRFVDQPIDAGTNVPMAADVSVEATDVNGNRDLDFISGIDLSSSGTMTGDPIQVSAISGLATWTPATDPIILTIAENGVALTASYGPFSDVTSNTFDVIQTADRVAFTSYPIQGQTNQVVGQIVISALKPDLTVDNTFTGDVTLSKATGPGSISGTLTLAAVDGVATFTDILFTMDGDYTVEASAESYMANATSGTIVLGPFFEDFESCPPSGWVPIVISGNSWTCGSGYASVSGVGGASATEAWYIVTPDFDFSTLTTPVLSFDTWTSDTDISHPRLEVFYSTDYPGSGNPNIYSWIPLTFGVPIENSQVWNTSGLIDLSSISTTAYMAFKYTSSGTESGSATEWRIDNVSITELGCTPPPTQPSNLVFSDVQSTELTLNWDNGDGTGRIILAREGAPVGTDVPVDNTNYTADPSYGSGTPIGSSFVVYKGNGNNATVTGLTANNTYHFAIHEYNCDADNPTFNSTSPLIGNQLTNASDIVVDGSFTYPTNIAYGMYQAPSISMVPGNSLSVFGLTLRDGGESALTDGLTTSLSSITFSTNGSQAIRAAAIYNGSVLIGEVNVNGSSSFTLDLSGNPIIANDTDPGKTVNFELKVTFQQGSPIIDNDQIVYTVTGATVDASSTLLSGPDAGGAESSSSGTDNTIIVVADQLSFVQVPTTLIPVNEDFAIEVETIDSKGSRDLDAISLTISRASGTGLLSSVAGLTQNTTGGSAVWNDLNYDTEESGVEFLISDGGSLSITTNPLDARNTFTIFTFTGSDGDEISFPPDYQPPFASIIDISRADDLTPELAGDEFNASGWNPNAIGIDTLGSYYEFRIISSSGYNFDFSSLQFDCRRSGTGPRDIELRTSADEYATILDNFTMPNDDQYQYNQELIAAGLTVQTDLIVRIYASGSSNAGGTWRIDNLYIFGISNDIQAPSFTASYPKYDSVAVDGFDLLVNLDEAASVYYIVQDPAISAPTEQNIIDGKDGSGTDTDAEASGVIIVSEADSTFIGRVSGLIALDIYDVYFVLDDDTNLSSVTLLEDVPLSDATTDFIAAASQPSGSIPSTSDNSADSVAVFSFEVVDLGTADGAPTHVTKLIFNKGVGNEVADWSAVIGGARLYNDTEASPITITNTTINTDNLEIDIPLGGLTIEDLASEQLTLSVWLTTSVSDNEDLVFQIGGAAHGNETNNIGSQFNSTLTSLTSNTFTIDVDATRLNIISYSETVQKKGDSFSLSVESTDDNGNRDTDEDTDVTIVLGLGTGEISVNNPQPPTLTQPLSVGLASWTNLSYDINDEFITLITSSGTLIDDTTGVIAIKSPNDLIITTATTLTSSLAVNDVDIQSPNGNLIISPGVTLSVAGDFNIDGILNGTSGTVDFNAGGNALQQINGTIGTADFYNITVTNSGNNGVLSEVNINLHNTLKLDLDANFDVDGSINDKDFTLISTPSYTARIATIEDGATLNGEVVWQRSLRTGPQGWRYVATPIKGQTVAEWIDDVYIQGIEGQPNSWRDTNFATYSEPIGTQGQSGFEGWIKYNTLADPIAVGVGNKLWEWDQFYAPELTILNKGLPTIGNGGDNTITGTETIDFPISFTSTAFDGGGWNFFANPYPCELDWNSAGFTHDNIEGGAVYIWNPDSLQYGTFDGTESINGVTQYIASGQAFFIKAIDGTPSTVVSVSEGAKSTQEEGNSFLRESDEQYASLKLKIRSDQNHSDETVVTFKSFATDGYDPLYDARKLAGGWVNLSSKLDNDLLMAINSMGKPRGVQRVKVDIGAYYFGNYSFTFPKMENFDGETVMYLKDNLLDKSVVITPNSKYSFKIEENNLNTYGSDRFEIQLLSPVKFSFDNVQAKAGQEFVIPVYADQLSDIIRTQMALGWNTEALSFIGIEDTGDASIGDFDLVNTENGKLNFNKSVESPVDLPDGTQLFSLRFKALNGQQQTELRFEKNNMKVTAINDIDMPFSSEDILIDILQNRFVAGGVATYSGVPVRDVLVNAAGDELIEKITDQQGDYSLETFEQSKYTISATKTDDLDFNDVVTTLDIIKSRRHMLQKEVFTSPYQFLAADVNDSKSITAIDLVQMRKVVLGIEDGFSTGLNWLFIPKAYDLTEDPFSYNTAMEVTLEDQDIDFDFVGVKVGDVDNSWNNESANRISKGNLELSLEHLSLKEGYIEIPVIVKDFNDISGYQFSVTWDASQLEYAGLEHQSLEGFVNDQFVNDGVLTMIWYESEGISVDLDNGSALFKLKFTARDENANSLVEINSELTDAVAYDGKLNSLAIKSISANVNFNELRNGKLELLQNVPNPFEYTTRIDFKINKPGRATLTIVNLLGEVVFLHKQMYDTGVYNIHWDRSQGRGKIAPGIYLYRLECNGEEAVRKMLIE